MIRKAIFWSHLVVGLIAGAVFLVLCATGALLSFEEQTVHWAERSALALPPAGVTERMPTDALVALAAKAEPSRPTGVHYINDPRSPVRVDFANGNGVCVNGYTGAVIGRGATSLRAFYRFLTIAHTRLALPISTAKTGSAIIDICNLAAVFLVLTGFFLWWPKKWKWSALRKVIVLRFDVGGWKRDWNWHNSFGFWALIPLFVMAGTGVVLSYRGVNQEMIELAHKYGSHPIAPPTLAAPNTTMQEPVWTQIMASVEQSAPGWRSISIRWPADKQSQAIITVCKGTSGETQKCITLFVDPATAAITQLQRWENRDAGVRARAIARNAHTGGLGGLPGQMLACLGCLAGVMLVYTGFALSWRRFFGRRGSASITAESS